MRKKSLLIIKPDAIQQKLVGRIITFVEQKFMLHKMKSIKLSREIAQEF
jgi:nucleoside diphosphate kinase